jgi:ElaB/YqjD/DUF883 family membrane-anchored ribosome-binding protein
MAQESDLAHQDPEVIRQNIEETRSALTEKLESLEQEVKDTVTGAKEAVTETVEAVKETVENTVSTVKETVHETVSTVKRTFDLRYQTDQHPWTMVGGSLAAGFVAGCLVPTPGRRWANQAWDRVHGSASSSGNGSTTSYRPVENTLTSQPTQPEEPGLLSGLADQFQGEIAQLKGLAIGTALGILRDTVTRSLSPQFAGQVRGVFDSVTTKLGGQPIQGEVLENFSQRSGTAF